MGFATLNPSYVLTVEQTDHTKPLREFLDDPRGFVEAAIGD
jgi:hypothetical protein